MLDGLEAADRDGRTAPVPRRRRRSWPGPGRPPPAARRPQRWPPGRAPGRPSRCRRCAGPAHRSSRSQANERVRSMAGCAGGRRFRSRSNANSASPVTTTATSANEAYSVGSGRQVRAAGATVPSSHGHRRPRLSVRRPGTATELAGGQPIGPGRDLGRVPPTRAWTAAAACRKAWRARLWPTNGVGATVRPISSQRTTSSTVPRPSPPVVSGSSTAGQPWSTITAHSSRS